ncbi:MAG: hypothetical protein Q8O57_02710, partial [Kiritimatiellota bacterium]|nr:hypothetical protein [Kiritimatiellota bacterium]
MPVAGFIITVEPVPVNVPSVKSIPPAVRVFEAARISVPALSTPAVTVRLSFAVSWALVFMVSAAIVGVVPDEITGSLSVFGIRTFELAPGTAAGDQFAAVAQSVKWSAVPPTHVQTAEESSVSQFRQFVMVEPG